MTRISWFNLPSVIPSYRSVMIGVRPSALIIPSHYASQTPPGRVRSLRARGPGWAAPRMVSEKDREARDKETERNGPSLPFFTLSALRSPIPFHRRSRAPAGRMERREDRRRADILDLRLTSFILSAVSRKCNP